MKSSEMVFLRRTSTSRVARHLAMLLFLAIAFACVFARSQDKSPSTVIINAQVADGTGAPLRRVSARVSGDRIVTLGDFKPKQGETTIDAKGLVLAPGFIDIHNHSTEGLEKDPLAETQIAQGITTVILGPDGDSPWPLGAWLDTRRKNPASVNLAVLVGHATVREEVLGKDFRRAATPAEVEKMSQLVDQAMREGAIGLSSGLEYDMGTYSTTDEVVALATTAAKLHGFYMTHIPVEHSHIKLGTVSVWGKAQQYIRVIEAARLRSLDFLADCYPYDAWHSNIKVLVPDKQYEDPKSVAKALSDVGGPSHVTIVEFSPNTSYENH